jgi:hypothetical protein
MAGATAANAEGRHRVRIIAPIIQGVREVEVTMMIVMVMVMETMISGNRKCVYTLNQSEK